MSGRIRLQVLQLVAAFLLAVQNLDSLQMDQNLLSNIRLICMV